MPSDFSGLEISNYDGKPIVLYEFYRGSGGTDFYWRYNTSESDFTFLGNVFLPTAISDGGITQSGEAQNSQLVISMPMAEAFPTMFRTDGNVPSDLVWVTVWRTHSGLVDDARVIWSGTVAAMSQVDEVKAQITCNVLVASFKRPGLRLPWGRTCPHTTYDSQCRLNPDDFKVTGTIAAFTGNSVTADVFGFKENAYFAGGYIEWVLASGLTERRYIKVHTGDTVTISGSTFGMTAGDPIVAVAGDDHTAQTCSNKFNNIDNYGGFPDIPGVSPFNGNPVF